MVNAITAQLFVDGVWTTFAAYETDGWTIQIGPDVESGTRPNKLTVTFQNPTLTMDPSRADSPLYGKIGRNTPVRLQLAGTTLVQAEASDWQPDRTVEHTVTPVAGRAWTDVTGEGLLRRLGRWTEPLQSAMRFYIGGYLTANGMTGYAPLEDPVGSTTLDQVVPIVTPGLFSGTVTLAGDNGPGGSDSCVQIGSDGVIKTYFRSVAASGYQIAWACKLPAVPASATYLPIATWTDTAGRTWVWQINNVGFGWTVTDNNGTLLSSLTSVFGFGIVPNGWLRFRMRVTIVGGNVQYEPAWYPQDAGFIVGVTVTFAGTTTGQPKVWTAAGNTYTSGAAYAHVFSVTDTALDLGSFANSPGLQAFNGFVGELPLTRWLRLLGQYGLTGVSLGASTGPAMGRQKPGVLLDLLTECVVTDGGIQYDDPLTLALAFATRDGLCNRTPRLALTRAQLSEPFRRRIDDVGKVNVVTASNANGDKVIVSLTTGALSTQPPPAGIGEYRDTVEVNVQDSVWDLTNRGYLELNKGTLDRPRYDTVTIDLLRQPGLAAAVTALRPYDTITISGEEPDTIVLRVISLLRKGDGVADMVTISCLPGEMYQIAIVDDTAAVIDSTSSTLNAGITATATTFVVKTTDPVEAWSTTSAYDLNIAGERIGVPAGGMGALAGTLQTVTGAVRSKNGIVKAQLAAAPVVAADPRYIF